MGGAAATENAASNRGKQIAEAPLVSPLPHPPSLPALLLIFHFSRRRGGVGFCCGRCFACFGVGSSGRVVQLFRMADAWDAACCWAGWIEAQIFWALVIGLGASSFKVASWRLELRWILFCPVENRNILECFSKKKYLGIKGACSISL